MGLTFKKPGGNIAARLFLPFYSFSVNDYRSFPRIVSSDLTELKNRLYGKPDFQSSPVLEFGTRFHDLLLLETDVVPTGKGATAQKRIGAPKRLDVMQADSLFCRLIETAQVETARITVNC